VTAKRPRRGRLIAIEGIDGSGKSSLVRGLGRALRRHGWSVALRHEPADRSLGLLAQLAGRADAWTGGVYFTLDRFLARPELERDLASNDLVVTDRSFYSTLAYQGSALGLRERRRLAALQRLASIEPDRVVLLDLAPEAAIRRLGGRSGGRGPLEQRAILRRVARSYRALARSGGWIVVDAGLPRAVVLAEALHRLERTLPSRRRR
jgi:dTMP kinase